MALKVAGIGVIVLFFLTVGVFAYFRKDLPQISSLSGDKLGGSITYYDRTGKTILWQDYNAVKRIPVSFNNTSPYMRDATVAIEDKDFYHEGAFNVRGIVRAAYHDIFSSGGGQLQGGSTITQQVVKLNEQWTDNRTITRKVKELILAVELEREYSKNDILNAYLNIAPYGGVEYGCESAARDYFHTSCKDLTLPEAAMLAAIPQSPAVYSPYSSTKYNPEVATNMFDQSALITRQHYVLDEMVQQGYITSAQAAQAKKVNVLADVHQLNPKYQGIKAPYFVLAAKQQLEDKYGAATVQRGGWKVITTLDLKAQDDAEQLVQQNLPNVEANGGDEEALVAEDVKTGQIVALVGGTNFDNPDYGQINYASNVLIPPGSSFKPYDYATLINNSNAGAGSVLYDIQQPVIDPASGAGYPCTNKTLPPPNGNGNCLEDYDFRYPGPETLRYALAGSRNVPAVKAMIEAGVNKTIQTATNMMNPDEPKGTEAYNCYTNDALTQKGPCYPSAAIGDGAYLHLDDHVNGLATLARLGKSIPRTFILKIVDSSGNTVDQFQQPKGTQVINPQTAYIVDNMLSDPNASYLPGHCTSYTCTPLSAGGYKFQHDNGWDFAVKTGTTNDNFDGLMTSWSTQYSVVSWVGYHTRNVAMTAGAMEYMTEPLTRGMMEDLHAGLKPENWQQPAGIQHLPAFVIYNHVGVGSIEPSPSTDIYPSWYKPKGAGGTEVIDKVSGDLATSCTPADAKQYITNGNANSFSIDEFVNGGLTSRYNTTAHDDVHNCNDSPPQISLTVSDPNTGAPTSDCNTECTVTATVSQGTHPLSGGGFGGNVTFFVNGQQIKSSGVSGSPSTVSFNYSPAKSGSGTITATVTDSVLYQASASKSVNFTSGAGQNPVTNPQATSDGNMTTITWTGGSAPFTVTDSSSGALNCSSSGCQVDTNPDAPIGSQVIITDKNGSKKSTSVSGP